MKKVRSSKMKKRLTMREVYDKLEISTPTPLLDLRSLPESEMPEWYKKYGLSGTEFREIDYYSVLKFGDFVLDDFIWDDDIYTILQDLDTHMRKLSLLFYRQKKLTYDKLWEIESITFNPIHNYDSNIRRTNTRTGSESKSETEAGTNKNSRTEMGGTTDTNKRSGSEKDANTNTNTNTETHSVTSYNTNEINKNENVQNNELIATHTYDNVLDERTTVFKDRQTHDDSENSNERNETKTYNSVTDTFEETHSGNIGVTTSTAMLSEFVNFYENYSFFEHLIGDFVQFICRADFETGVD